MTLKNQERRKKSSERLKVFLPSIVITLIGFLVAYQFVQPAPPKEITIATGDVKGAYHACGERYREILSRHGITLNVRSTKGTVENLELLRKGEGAEIAFVQGGVGDPASMSNLNSLASVYFEPLWVFLRVDAPVKRLTDLRGKRIALGEEGSGTRSLALLLLKENGVDEKNTTLLPWDGEKARSSIIHWYKELQAVDHAFMESHDPAGIKEYLAELDRIDREVAKVEVPLSYASELYGLRVHISHLRKMIEAEIR